MRRIERNLASRPEVTQYSSFVGQSSPRFYYNVNPQQPDGAYGQVIVQTKEAKITPSLVAKLRSELPYVVPEAQCIVKELQQGSQMEAPLEVRISGDDVTQLKEIAQKVEGIVRAQPAAELVHNDYYEDSYFVDVAVNDELANRSGLTNSNVAQVLAGGFDGQPVSTFWEGNRAVTIKVRLDPAHRSTFGDVSNTYVPSHITNARLPVRAIGTLEPEWQTSRIVRRNGVYTITVRAFPKRDHYASELLKGTAAQIKAIPLPAGFHITYGGELFNQNETFPEMIRALSISLAAIFLILMLQFRSIDDPLVVMCSIPLALFGAVVGLLVTHNPFGFTAFMGLISLCGIVVRNGIVLVDYIHEKMREGHPLEEAAMEAGERRLRPIFLTTMAAAVGVTPMILSRSSLWSPLASVIAMGLIFSMFFTLLVVPVLFVLVKSRSGKATPQAAAVLLLVAMLVFQPVAARAQETPAAASPGQAAASDSPHAVKLTLQEAVDLALKQNRALKIARAKVKENDAKVVTSRGDLYPQLSNDDTLIGVSNKESLEIPAGALGNVPGVGPYPQKSTSISQGENTVLLNNTTITQSLTQLYKIRAGVRAASADVRVAKADLQNNENEIALAVHQVYYGLLVAQRQRQALIASRTAAEQKLKESQDSVQSGVNLEVVNIGARASLLSTRQELLTAENQISDLTSELDDLLGLPPETELELEDAVGLVTPPPAREECMQKAYSHNPELRAAKEQVVKARAGLDAAHDEYIPDLGAYYTHTYQNGLAFLTHNNDEFGAKLTWRIFDGGKRRGVVAERSAQLEEAEQNVQRLEGRIAVEIDKAYRKVERSKTMIEVAEESLALRKEGERIAQNQATAGVIQQSQYDEALSATAKAEAERLQAQLSYELAISELNKVIGLH
jgi:outer membrane protein TolC